MGLTTDRRCEHPGCGTLLRRSNPTDYCSLHHRPEAEIMGEEVRYIDGPGLVVWIAERIDLEGVADALPNVHRRLIEWERGALATVEGADNILTQFGLHIFEIPASLYRSEMRARNNEQARRVRQLSRQDRLAILAEAEATTVAATARRHEVSQRTIRLWRQKYGRTPALAA